MRKILIAFVAVFLAAGCSRPFDRSDLIARAGKDTRVFDGRQYDVRILRDSWGVPHVFGRTDADVAFGLAYAHCEDDFETIQNALLASRGKLASVYGRKAAPNDYMVNLMRVWDVVNAKYETDLSPETRAICEAAAVGVNHYALAHPEKVKPGVFPVGGKDVVAGFVHRGPFFFGLDDTLRELSAKERKRQVSEKAAQGTEAFEPAFVGSNTFAVAPSRTANGETFLAINSHQPWTGPVAWYEAHLHSEEGWDMVGGVFPGSPVVLHGHNRHLGWAHTVNFPDLVDVYVLDINPDNRNQYRFDGEWRTLEVRVAPIEVKLLGPISWTFKKEVLWSVYGPAVRTPHGTYAIRYAGMGEVRQIEQWYRMNKARNFDEWLEAVKLRGIPSFNIGYADEDGNIFYLYNALLPVRAEGYDWREYLPGDTSETLWTEYVPFEKLPHVRNPASGFIQNCNSTPFQTTNGDENPRPEEYSPTCGIETHMTNRALRALELFGSDKSITEEEFYAYKYDMTYSKQSLVAQAVEQVLQAPPSDDPVVNEALEVLRAWDLRTNPENRGAAIGVLTARPVVEALYRHREPPDIMETFVDVAHKLKRAYGRIDVPWSEVNRLRRGTLDLGVGGGPDTLHAVSGEFDGKHIIGDSGDCYVLLVKWDHNGVSSRSIHQFGSATLDETSPHYADQSPLFVKRQTKPVWLDEADIRAHLEREYHPGEELQAGD